MQTEKYMKINVLYFRLCNLIYFSFVLCIRSCTFLNCLIFIGKLAIRTYLVFQHHTKYIALSYKVTSSYCHQPITVLLSYYQFLLVNNMSILPVPQMLPPFTYEPLLTFSRDEYSSSVDEYLLVAALP